MKTIFQNFSTWCKSFAKRSYKFWLQTEINEERIKQHRDECLKYYYPTMRW